jgi:hypothetical protein
MKLRGLITEYQIINLQKNHFSIKNQLLEGIHKKITK